MRDPAAALTYTFGTMVGDTRQGWAILTAFLVMALIGVFVCYGFEAPGIAEVEAITGIESHTALVRLLQDDDIPGATA